MAGSQKSLSVSYGTFSCTLDGFEDSLDAMKAIAEFFRDLAAQDRCFGAEMPVPDAEALARIVEREVARRVGVQMERTVLRGDDAAVGSVGPDAAPGMATRAPDAAPAPALSAAVVAAAMAPAAPAMPPPSAVRAAQDEGAAATHPGIGSKAWPATYRAAIEPPPEVAETPRGAGDGAEPVGAQDVAPAAAAVEPTLNPMAVVTPAARSHPGAEAALVESAEATFPEPVAHLRPHVVGLRRAMPETESGRGQKADSVPDVGAAALPEGEPAPGAVEPGAASLLSPEAEADLMAELAALEAALGAAAPVAIDVKEAEDAAEAAVAGLMAALDGVGSSASDAAPTRQAPSTAPLGVTAGPTSEARDVDVDVGAILAAMGVTVAVPDAEAEAEAPGEYGAARGDEASAPEWDASAPAAWEADDPAAPGEPALEATLPNAAVEPARPEEPARRHLAAPPVGDEAAVSRLLSRADAQLAEPEASRRREAIAQLRAAVAATEAARRLGEPAPEPQRREDSFRDDLRQAVRPRRPVLPPEGLAGARAERPRPTPLKLVTSQRVDLPAPEATAEPVRPRRVAVEAAMGSHGEASPAGSDSPSGAFAAFAAEVGAVSLIDILEAAAAFTSFVEGAEDFSRPQVLDRVRQASPAGFSREDGLRSFDTLLRQGTITRVRGGRFQVTGESRFNPARRAG